MAKDSTARMAYEGGPFAVRVEEKNELMPEFEVGDLVIADPDQKPVPGNLVIAEVDGKERFARYPSTGKTGFKVLAVVTTLQRNVIQP